MPRDDTQEVFRCDYCGKLAPLDEGRPFYVPVDQLTNGQRIHIAAVYCSTYCGRTASSRSGSGRG